MNWEQFKSGPSGPELPSDVEPGEPELLEAFDRWIHTAHPNAERKGCPGKSVLMTLALAKEKFDDEYTLGHIGRCAACLDDLKQIKRELTGAGSSQ
jgi:hypothetical protein